MSVHDAITEMNDVVFDPDCGFGEAVIVWPDGVEANAFSILANVFWGQEEGNNQIRGEGRNSLNRDRGRSVRRSIVVRLPKTRVNDQGQTVPVFITENGKSRILVQLNDTTVKLSVKRIQAQDVGVQDVLCHDTREYLAQSHRERMG